jgi:Membrane domain of glycerophosphoryl diester phosphodiesterase
MNPTDGVIGDSWELYKKHWRHLAPIALIVYIVLGVVAALLASVFDNWLAGLLSAMIGIIGAFWLQGALVKAVADVRDGRADMSIQDTFRSAWPHVPAVAVAGILAGLGIALGLLLLIVPGLVLMTWWVVIIPAIILEDKSASESFSRSRELVRGYGWNVFGVIVLTILLLIVASIVIALILSPLDDWLQELLSDIISGTLIAPFIAVTWTLLYFRLRNAKEQAQQPPPPPATAAA